VDTLAKRYGWSHTEISENMYWENVYEMYEYASNLNTLEKNEQMKFNFLLHATSKEAVSSWKDLLIPFPDRDWKRPTRKRRKLLSPKLHSKQSSTKMSPEQRARAEYVKERIAKNKKKAAQELQEYHYGK
jgi:hypothetical protein